jgi:hypothetical protein
MARKSPFIRLLTAALPAIVAAGFCDIAHAQKVGTYSGKQSDGGFISFTVTESAGVFSLGSMNVNFSATCKNPGAGTTNEGWGFYLNQPISGGAADFHSFDHYYDISGSLTFVTDHVVKGTVTSVTAVFVPGPTPPTQAHFCKTAKLTFSAKSQP